MSVTPDTWRSARAESAATRSSTDGPFEPGDGEWIVAYEKGTKDPAFDHIDYGAIALRKSVVLELPERQRSGLDELQTRLARRQRLRAWVARERFYEIGSPEGLAALEERLK